jgi:protein-tyrosine phosphatase
VSGTRSVESLRPRFARDGIFNIRDLGGIALADGASVAPGRVIRADALQRAGATESLLHELGVARVLDLRDERERDAAGVLASEVIEVVHHPVLDPTFTWHDDAHPEPATLLAHRYQVILDSFSARFAGAVESMAAVLDTGSAVAYHCAVGKDRTGLLTALVLDTLGASDEAIVADYVRSARATAVQVNWLWSLGMPQGDTSDEELATGVWSARPATMATTLAWLETEHGGARRYLSAAGVPDEVFDTLGRTLAVPAERR